MCYISRVQYCVQYWVIRTQHWVNTVTLHCNTCNTVCNTGSYAADSARDIRSCPVPAIGHWHRMNIANLHRYAERLDGTPRSSPPTAALQSR